MALFLLVWMAAGSCWGWELVRAEKRAAPSGVEFLHCDVRKESRTESLDLLLCDSQRLTLRVIDDPADRLAMPEALRDAGCVAGVNGGFFHPDRTPLGLLVVRGKKVHPVETSKLLSGILVVRGGNVTLLRPASYPAGASASDALQAGPFLVEKGAAVKGLNATRGAARTVVLTGRGFFALATTTCLTLAEVADVLATPGIIPGFRPERALNLDGGTSTALWVSRPGGDLYHPAWKRVRNYVGIAAR